MTWSPDAAYIASAGEDFVSNVWAIDGNGGGEHVTTLAKGHGQTGVTAVVWLPGQASALATAGGNATVGVWDIGDVLAQHVAAKQAKQTAAAAAAAAPKPVAPKPIAPPKAAAPAGPVELLPESHFKEHTDRLKTTESGKEAARTVLMMLQRITQHERVHLMNNAA